MRITSSYIIFLFHAAVWIVVLFFPFFIADPDNGYAIGSVPGAFFTIAGFIHFLLFYINAYYLLPVFLNRRNWWLYILLSLLLVASSLLLKTVILHHWFPQTSISPVIRRIIFAPSVGVYVFSIVYRKIMDNIRRERLQKEERAERLATELKFLRSQINPHFLFNTLTSLVSLARKKSELLEPALIQLSDLMRYMLYDTQGKRVPLSKEVTYLRNYIALQQLRFDEGVDVSVAIELAPTPGRQYFIEPMLLIPFVENAFKHGTAHLDHPEIVVYVTERDGQLVFCVKNRIGPSLAETSTDRNAGIGLANVRKRLDLLYGKTYRLDIDRQNGWYKVTLTLFLS